MPSLSEWNCSRTRNYDDITAPQSICREFPAIECSSRFERFLSHESEEDEVSKVQTVNQFRGLIIPLGKRTITIYDDMSYTIHVNEKRFGVKSTLFIMMGISWRLVFNLQALPFQLTAIAIICSHKFLVPAKLSTFTWKVFLEIP